MTRVLNLECLHESCGGDTDFARELFTDLAQRAETLRETLGAALEQNNAQGVRKSAHELKGSCLTLGAEAVADVCNRLETLAYENKLEGAAPLILELDSELASLWTHLQEQGIYP